MALVSLCSQSKSESQTKPTCDTDSPWDIFSLPKSKAKRFPFCFLLISSCSTLTEHLLDSGFVWESCSCTHFAQAGPRLFSDFCVLNKPIRSIKHFWAAPGSRAVGLQDFWLQGSRVPGLQGSRAPGFQGSRVPGLQGLLGSTFHL